MNKFVNMEAAPVVAGKVYIKLPYVLLLGEDLKTYKLSQFEQNIIYVLDKLRPTSTLELARLLNKNYDEMSDVLKSLQMRGIIEMRRQISFDGGGIDCKQIDLAMSKGIEGLKKIQKPSGSLGDNGCTPGYEKGKMMDIFETGGALRVLFEIGIRGDWTERAVDFLIANQHPDGWFNWDSEGKYACAETTAICAMALMDGGRVKEANKAADYIYKNNIIDEYMKSYGVVCHHGYPSVIAFIANMYLKIKGTIPDYIVPELLKAVDMAFLFRGQGLYYFTPYYCTKELLHVLDKIGHPAYQELMERCFVFQNDDGGFGFVVEPQKSAILPTAMMVSSVLTRPCCKNAGLEAAVKYLLKRQDENNVWPVEKYCQITCLPDEFTNELHGFGWQILLAMVKSKLIKKHSMGRRMFVCPEFKNILFMSADLDLYSTPAWGTSLSLQALHRAKKAYFNKGESKDELKCSV
ncbi:MAG TPA: prenyltransferase/squalene oxidase repeat-containing protein [Clostridia bacterium]